MFGADSRQYYDYEIPFANRTKNMGTGKKLDCREIQYLVHIADALEEAGGRLDGGTLMKTVDKRMSADKLEALEALADGDGHLIPYIHTVFPGSIGEIIVCFDKNRKRICVPVDDAFSALAASRLSRKQIEEAVKECRPDFDDEIAA
jgi:hypothetical protein